ncbi:MAG: FAD-binding oxidoreductase [Actinomycetales bacterium]|nr:FAD-binding oxidoreductase [Actinomycetales bacterium]
MTRPTPPDPYPDGITESAPASVDDQVLRAFAEVGVPFSVDPVERAEHGRDWWPLSLATTQRGVVPHWPGVVLTPHSTAQVRDAVRVAARLGLAITAQGGRSGVLGGAVAPTGGVALDLTGLDRVLDLDRISGTVSTEAGIFGPDLERAVNAEGFTVGHFPQSFDLATVGGWLACRGAGQYSNRYGKIEDIVRGLTVVLASGDVVTLGGRGPRQAVGPDLVQLFVGSEGSFGVITEATLVLRPRPAHERRLALRVSDFDAGMEICRMTLQRDAHPAVLRLYDEVESKRNFDVDGCVLVVLDEGEPLMVDATLTVLRDVARDAETLDVGVVARWLEHRNDVSALAPLWASNIVVDTIEVSGPWSILTAVREAALSALRSVESTLVASVHQSHAYVDGACLYFTFAGKPAGDPLDYYRAAWDAATTAVLDKGAALSHHHGVGRNRSRFVRRALGDGFDVLGALKGLLDPADVLNPGVLGLGGEPW